MPYLVLKKNGRRQQTPFVFTQVEIDRLANDRACYVVQNTSTRRKSRVGVLCRRGGKIPRMTPRHLNGLGVWPFDKLFKKKPKTRVGDKFVHFVTDAKGKLVQLRGSRRRRKKRR